MNSRLLRAWLNAPNLLRLPDRGFYYLIGVRITNGESVVQHSLWADTVEDEGKIWRELLSILETVEKPVLVHYGSYETEFLKRMSERYGGPTQEISDNSKDQKVINLLSVLSEQVYFPTHSNSLKEIAPKSVPGAFPTPIPCGTPQPTKPHTSPSQTPFPSVHCPCSGFCSGSDGELTQLQTT